MKITIITPAFPYPKRGDLNGLERYVENLAYFLKKKNNDIKIITTYWNGGNKFDNYKGIQILRILDSKALLGRIGSIFCLNYVSFGLNLYRKKNLKFIDDSDAIITFMALGFTNFFKIKKVPMISVYFHYDFLRSFLDYLTYPFLHYLEKKQFKRHKNIITISNASKNDIIKYYNINEKYIKVIPAGIDKNKFNPSNFSQEIRKNYGNNILLYSGLMIYRKRISLLLKAMPYVIKEIPDVQLILTGTGLLWNYFKKLSISLGIQKNTNFLGFVEDEELLKYYASSDLFVFPSESEGFGQVILEAMASGTPVICANKPPMSDIIGRGGITFKLNDSKDLSKKIIRLLKNKNQLEELREKALDEIKKYEWKNIVKTYINHFQHIINEKELKK